ncbi:MAG: UDP-N-acetylmuramoyl-L-alanyl-D-glutamate--2,6-diaminopimelate ligase [Spirochaetaceae bacterium]|jgi:UDP-N-acetylmuramoyl-L-alanyl-D-glutamate--2,6-diaminopimelate ligase|nr:UDP-N-acetylmuramoyl-L-alanyl-D-glutamate--2,6-diaminopimelate ligase [Spirochaetaceae bacterium]
MAKRLSELMTPQGAATISIKTQTAGAGAELDPVITNIVYDSRAAVEGSLFFALPGIHTDGNRFITQAVKNGAKAVVYQGSVTEYVPGAVYLQVADARFSMSPVSDRFFDTPSESLGLIGVTGTEGKSSTVSFIWQLLRLAGKKAGFISTVQYSLGGEEMSNPEHQTTPEAPVIHEKLAAMVQNGAEYAVVESSSHGLSPRTNRLGDVRFDCAVMTNVTHEHLEFHGTHGQYKEDKANLFRALDKWEQHGQLTHEKQVSGSPCTIPAFGIVNMCDPAAAYFAAATDKPVFGFTDTALSPENIPQGLAGYVTAEEILDDSKGVSFSLTEYVLDEDGTVTKGIPLQVRLNLPGTFNVKNAMAALIAVSRILDIPPIELTPLLSDLKPVRGRMTAINKGQPFEVIVDYAHTPSSFETVFPPLRERLQCRKQVPGRKPAPGRIISLFGSGGERDIQKRPEQGRIAAEYSDIVILADEDPRGEDPMELLEMIAEGCTGKQRDESLFLIPDRPQAIRKAFALAKEGDIVLLLGKGHENSIIYQDVTISYDEITEAETALAEMGWGQ